MACFDPHGTDQYVIPYGMQVDRNSDSSPDWVVRHYLANTRPDYLMGAAVVAFLEYASAGDKCPESLYRVEALLADRLLLEAEAEPHHTKADGIMIGDVCRAFRSLIGQDEDAVLYALDAWRQGGINMTTIRSKAIGVVSNYMVNVARIEPRFFK